MPEKPLTKEDLVAALKMVESGSQLEVEVEKEVDLLASCAELDEDLHRMFTMAQAMYGSQVAANAFVFSFFHFGFSVGRCIERIKNEDSWWKENVKQHHV